MMKSLAKAFVSVICLSVVFASCLECDAKADRKSKTAEMPQEETVWPFSDMVLCYGGSAHRTPFKWDEARFSDYVTYLDEEGVEHWLFDGFLFLEFCNLNRGDGMYWSYCTGYSPGHNRSAGRDLWQEQIDYWFAEGNGFNALEQAVKDASRRLGKPATKRKVVMSIPDPILFFQYDDTSSTTRYWGELDGRELDFARPEDRVAACSWFADEILERFRKAKYKYIELDGFYKISEAITTPHDGWNYEMKKMDLVIPGVSEHLHGLGMKYYWIPYRQAAGYANGGQYGLDFTWMQPNYFWHGETYPFDNTMLWILDAGIGMEMEMDPKMFEGSKDCELYRARFRKYLQNAKRYRLYGKFPFTYYVDTDGFRTLRASTAEEDVKIYHELCRFIIENPVREKCR